MRHDFHPTSLREYDIRGIIGETLGEADAYAIGRSFGTRIARAGGSRVAVGYDGRTSSPGLEAKLVEGLNASGVDAVRIGLGPTPMLYFAVHELGCNGGVMITGSHNPPNYNGFKMMLGQGPFFGADIQALGRMAAAGDWADGAGTSTTHEIMDRYVERLLQGFDGRAFNIAWDCGNGVAGPVVERLVKLLPGTHQTLFTDVDGAFPNHHPDPTDEANLVDLKRVVAERGCDFGVAFDGDGDRIGVVDETGRIIWGDELMVLLSRNVLAENPGATIIAEVKCSQTLFDDIEKNGGVPIMWKAGHSIIKSKMKETSAALAGEMSGHIFFADRFYGFDDATYAGARVLEILSKTDKPLSDLLSDIPKTFSTPELRTDCPDETKFKVVEQIAEYFGRDHKVITIDGARILFENGWGLVRASNTQAILVSRFEADSDEHLKNIREIVETQMEKAIAIN